MGLSYLFRFFRVYPVVPPLMIGGLAIVVVVAGAAIAVEPSTAGNAVKPLLLLHMFAASSGFVGQARRGFYDLVLTSGEPRGRIALVHWALSVLPGIVSWLLLAVVEILVTSGNQTATISSGSGLAFLLVSVLAWAITVPWPRLTGGIGWLVMGSLAPLLLPSAGGLVPLTRSLEQSQWIAPLLVMLYPWRVTGKHLSRRELTASVPALVVVVIAMVMACAAVRRLNVTLEAAQ